MSKQPADPKAAATTPKKMKKRRLGVSKLGLVETVPWEIADAEIEKMFEDSKLFPDE